MTDVHLPRSRPRPSAPLSEGIKRVTTWLTQDFLGGPRPWTLAALINTSKAGTPIFLAFLLWWYGNTSAQAMVYFALHGTYGAVWFLKDRTFPDPRWRRRVTIAGGINVYLLVLVWYWAFGWMVIAGQAAASYPLPDTTWFALCIVLCTLGIAIMMAADAQKYFTLRAKPGLITDGMFAIVRHPNYLGEMMIYGSLALMVWRPLPFVVLALIWSLEFAPNMRLKEVSMSRYPQWDAYRGRTWWLIPYLF